MSWDLRQDNPVKGVEKFREEKRHRWLSTDELSRLTAALDRHANIKAADAIRLQLLTGARIGEILTARWEDFDLQRGVWTKPSHHTKTNRTFAAVASGGCRNYGSKDEYLANLIFDPSGIFTKLPDLNRRTSNPCDNCGAVRSANIPYQVGR